MNSAQLEKSGLSQNEAKVYLALLTLGQSTSGPLIKETRLNSAKVYESLTKLQNKGLVGCISKEGKKHFESMSPQMLLKLIEGQQEQLDRDKQAIKGILPQLNLLQNGHIDEAQTAVIYYGQQSYRILAERSLEEVGENGDIIAICSVFKRNVDPYWVSFWRKIQRMHIHLRVIWDQTILRQNDYPPAHCIEWRVFADKDYVVPVDIIVYNDKIMQVCYTNKTYFTLLIRSKELADSYRHMFESVWRTAKPYDVVGGCGSAAVNKQHPG